jgi:hypothetical protein
MSHLLRSQQLSHHDRSPEEQLITFGPLLILTALSMSVSTTIVSLALGAY